MAGPGYLEEDVALALESDLPVVQSSRGASEAEVVDELGAVDAPVLARRHVWRGIGRRRSSLIGSVRQLRSGSSWSGGSGARRPCQLRVTSLPSGLQR